MSTLEVACARCDKRFRVRAEFAGKTTRCPGCSAPITIGGSKPPPPPRAERADRPRPRPRPGDDEDDAPRRAAGNWKPVDAALGREQVAVVFGLLTILGSYLVYCLGSVAARSGPADGVVIGIMLLLLAGPALVAAVFAVSARVSAVGAPAESLTRGAAVASLLCGFAGLAALVMLGLTLLAGIDHHGPSELPAQVAVGGLILSGVGAVATFLGFVAQVGIACRSAEVSRAIGRAAVACSVCVLVLLGVGVLYALAVEATGPSYPSYGPHGGRASRDDGPFFMAMAGILFPLGLAVLLILYHRLLGAARRAVRDEPGGQGNG